ncbi:PAS and ANTAR domain-containing protein [Nocardia carnea]|uniref:PAS and ANTAR domain-containing protein n=1 Tax=Nocardia carnea TaxID=37328 RepID=UPI0003046D92|nr:PAS and ANTAR domain-containing protein [Nocardia carnea]
MTGIDEPAATTPLEAITATPQQVGSFRFWFADQRWEWSQEVAELYGYDPTVEPTTELLLAHKHPDDREHVAQGIADTLATGAPFSSRHRLIDTTGRQHWVIVVGDTLTDKAGTVVGTTGYCVDVTDSLQQQRRQALDETLPEIVESRAVIEQAKGMLMQTYGLNADQAFRVLQWRSQETNIKLREVAHRLVTAITAAGGGPVTQRTFIDHLLLTLHHTPPAP